MFEIRNPFVAASLLVIIGTVGVLAIDRLSRRYTFVMAGLFTSWNLIPGIASAVGVATGAYTLPQAAAPSGARLWILRLATALTITVVGVGLLKASWITNRLPRSASCLWLGAMAFGATLLLNALAAGTWDQGAVLAVLSLTVLWMTPRPSCDWVAAVVKRLCGTLLIASTVAMIVLPNAWKPYPFSLFPGVEARLQGIMSHPNMLGPIAVLYFVYERLRPSRPSIRVPLTVVALVLLILSQSKTSWVAAVFVLFVHWISRSPRAPGERVILAGAFACAVALIFSLSELPTRYSIVPQEELESIQTLTGRTDLWAYGLRMWQEKPVLGAGPQVFKERASERGDGWSGQAHNQYVQALSTSGIVGLLGLLTYLGVMCRLAIRHAERTRYASVMAVGVLLIHTMTETPMEGLEPMHLSSFCFLLALEAEWVRISMRRALTPWNQERGVLRSSAYSYAGLSPASRRRGSDTPRMAQEQAAMEAGIGERRVEGEY
jgi:hypothetical protein